MATTFNTRISLKYDSYNNWSTNNPILLKGEMAVVEVPDSTGVAQNEPTYLLKVGDGTNKFNDLKWISGHAADVYSWAKASTKPTYAAGEITGLDEYISGKVQDTNTKYQIVKNGNMGFKLQSKELNEEEWTDVNEIALVAPTYSLLEGEENGTVKFGITGSEQSVKVHGLGSAAYTETSAYDAAGTGASEAGKIKTQLVGVAEDTSDKDTIKGAKKYAEEKATAAQSAATGYTDSKISGLTSEGKTAGTGEVISSVTQANGVVTVQKKTLTDADIPNIPTSKVTNLDTTLAGKQDTLVFNTPYNSQSNKVATMTDVTNAVSGLSGAMHYVGESTTNPSTGTATVEGHEDWVSGDVVTYQSKEYVYDGENWRELGDESSYAIKGSIVDADIAANANIAQSKISGLESALAGKATPADITSAIQGLDVASTSVTVGNKITAIEEVDGKISVTTGAIVAGDIPTLPTTKITGLDTALSSKADASTVTGLGERLTTAEGDIDSLQTLIGETGVSEQISTAIGALNKIDSAVSNQFVTSVSQSNGVITVARAQPEIANINGLQAALNLKANDADLKTVAKTGKIDDLTQTATIIFNCGSSTEVM